MVIALDMYNAPLMRPLFAAVADHALKGVDLTALEPDDLALGQICGIDYVRAGAGAYAYLATFSVAHPDLADGYYHSVLIRSRAGGVDLKRDYDPATTPVAINAPGSFSGALALKAHLLDSGLALPEVVRFSGGHVDSIDLVARGQAAFAAIDRLSFAMARAQYPQMVAAVQVMGETAAVPGLPFVTSPRLPSAARARLAANVLALPMTPIWGELSAALELRGITALDPAAYDAIGAVDARLHE